MRRFTTILILLFSLILLATKPAKSFWWGDSLVTIDGTSYSSEDFKRWWTYWNDKDLPLPKTPDPYIDWLLLAREGKRMKLDSYPDFQHKTEVFLKFKSLIMLQREEIYEKVNITSDEFQARYKEYYTPKWHLVRLAFREKKAAEAARQKLADGVSIDELIKIPPREGGPLEHREDWRRPLGVHGEWAEIFKGLSVGEASETYEDLGQFIFYVLKEKEEGNPEDFEKIKQYIEDALHKEKVGILTAELLARLREKFAVKIDEERLAALDIDAADNSFSDKPVIWTNNRNVSEKQFVAIARKDSAIRSPAMTESAKEERKAAVANSIIEQNIVDWEALDRHYEEKEPLSWEYQFNRNHRLTTTLENKFFESQAKVSEDEMKRYYTENISVYTIPETVNFATVKDNDGVIDQIWTEVATGKDFFRVTKNDMKQEVYSQKIPLAHLDPAIQEVLKGLAKGETSRPFSVNDNRIIVHLIDYIPAEPIPLEKVAEKIKAKLHEEKVAQQRKNYLDRLKSGSKIEINESKWKEIQKELGEAK